jgi:hypothetical protein
LYRKGEDGMSGEDIITVGLSEATHARLVRLKEDGIFAEMKDGYRFGIGLSIAEGWVSPPGTKVKTFLNVGSLDPDGSLRNLISALYPQASSAPYAMAERLAEAGVARIGELHETGSLKFGDLVKQVEATKQDQSKQG